MPRPASIAWRRSILTGGDEIWIATTNSVGSIIGYWLEVPDPVFQAPQWNVQHIAGPGSANFAQAPRIAAAPAIAFDPFPSARGAAGRTSPRVDLTAFLYYVAYDRLGGQWYSRNVAGATGSVVAITVMPDDYVYILTVSSAGELIGWFGGYLDSPFVAMPIPAFGPAPTVVAAMAVRTVNSSQVEVHVLAGQRPSPSAPDTDNMLTYYWSTYSAGSSGGAGSFGPWQSNNILMPYLHPYIVYPTWPVSIALGPNPNGEVIITVPVEVDLGSLKKIYLYYFFANSPGSSWSAKEFAGPSSPFGDSKLSSGGVAVDGNGVAHCLTITAFAGPPPGLISRRSRTSLLPKEVLAATR
jgi:hypothetical protein